MGHRWGGPKSLHQSTDGQQGQADLHSMEKYTIGPKEGQPECGQAKGLSPGERVKETLAREHGIEPRSQRESGQHPPHDEPTKVTYMRVF